MKLFTFSQFNYCSIVWVFPSSSLNYKVNNIHERILCIVYQHFQSSSIKHPFYAFGINSIANIAAKIWNKLPNEIKELSSLDSF